MTAAMTQAVVLGARTAVCASTGNTAASLAAYAARAGLQAAILLPRGQITAAKLAQSLDYGALVCEIDGNFDDCMRLIQELGDDPSIYVANSINPFRIEGQKTVAFELMEQCDWQVPDHVVVPGGNMGNSTALGKGFRGTARPGIDRPPAETQRDPGGRRGAARAAVRELDPQADRRRTRSPGNDGAVSKIRRRSPPRSKSARPFPGRRALRAVLRSGGQMIAVSEQEIADAKAMIGRDGIGCEPASATTVAGIKKLVAAGHIQPRRKRGRRAHRPRAERSRLREPLSSRNARRSTPARRTARRHNQFTARFKTLRERVAATKSAILEDLGAATISERAVTETTGASRADTASRVSRVAPHP